MPFFFQCSGPVGPDYVYFVFPERTSLASPSVNELGASVCLQGWQGEVEVFSSSPLFSLTTSPWVFSFTKVGANVHMGFPAAGEGFQTELLRCPQGNHSWVICLPGEAGLGQRDSLSAPSVGPGDSQVNSFPAHASDRFLLLGEVWRTTLDGWFQVFFLRELPF